jgi:hypothetical protein
MTVIEWSDAHKLRALRIQVDTMTRIAEARETLLRTRCERDAAIKASLQTVREVVRSASDVSRSEILALLDKAIACCEPPPANREETRS